MTAGEIRNEAAAAWLVPPVALHEKPEGGWVLS